MRLPKVWVHALLIFLLGFGLRIWNMAKEPPSYEEMAATLVTGRGVLKYLAATPADFDFAPPVYYLAARPFAWFGPELWRLRLLSVLAGSAAGVLLVLYGRQLLGGRTATMAGYLLALHPLHVYFSQQMQPVALFTVVALVAFYFLVRSAEGNRSRHWSLFDLSAILLLLMMREAIYLIACFLIVHLARALFFPLTDEQRKLKRSKLLQAIGYNYGAILLAALPWLIVMPRGVRWKLENPDIFDLLRIPAVHWIVGLAPGWNTILPWLAILLFLLLLPPAVKAAREFQFRSFAVVACLAGAVLLPFANSLDDKPRFDAVREAAVALPFVMIAVAALIARCNFVVRTLLMAFLTIIFVSSTLRQSRTIQGPPFGQMMQAIASRAKSTDLVAFWPDYAVTIGRYMNSVYGTTYQIDTAENVLTQWADLPSNRPVFFAVAQFPDDNPILYTIRGALQQFARTEVVWENPRGYDAVLRTRHMDRTALKRWFLDPRTLEITDAPTSDTFFLFRPRDDVFESEQFHYDRLDASYDRAGRRVVWTAEPKVDLKLPVSLQPGHYVLRLHVSPEFDAPLALTSEGRPLSADPEKRSIELTLRAYSERRTVTLSDDQTITLNFLTDVEVREVPVHIETTPMLRTGGAKPLEFGVKIYSIAIDQAPTPGTAR